MLPNIHECERCDEVIREEKGVMVAVAHIYRLFHSHNQQLIKSGETITGELMITADELMHITDKLVIMVMNTPVLKEANSKFDFSTNVSIRCYRRRNFTPQLNIRCVEYMYDAYNVTCAFQPSFPPLAWLTKWAVMGIEYHT